MKNRPNRTELYRKICTAAGIAKPSSRSGYFSRKELVELLLFVEKDNTTKREDKEPCTREQVTRA